VLRNVVLRPPEDRRPAPEPRRGLGGRLLLGGLAALLVAVPFTLLALLVLGKWEPLARLDADVADRLNEVALSHAGLVSFFDVVAVAFDPWVFRVLVLGVAVWLWRREAERLALWAVLTMVIGGLLGGVLKLLVSRARPSFDDPVAHAGGYSFPSGHALNSFVCVGVLILVFLPALNRTGRTLAYTVGALVVLVTGLDRVALGVHYVSDVVAGWIVALACIAGTGAAFEIFRREHGERPSKPSEGVDPEAADELSDP
jgi:membrane-associated phospholipid phosphatase